MSISLEDIKQLERAAEVFLGDPTRVTAEQRREAESYFDHLQNSSLKLEQCLFIFEHTGNPFVLFQISKCISLAVFRDWDTLSENVIHNTYDFLVKCAVYKPDLPNFTVAELLKCSSRIFKRGIMDKAKRNSMSTMYDLINNLIISQNEQYRVLGCKVIEALASEFASSWGGSKYGLTWDFHLRAKREFEISGLKQLFKLSLQILGDLCNVNSNSTMDHDATAHLRLAENFLRIASLILSWNFSPKVITSNSPHYQTDGQHCDTAFRPQEEWKDVIQNPDFLTLFFTFHSKIRGNSSLAPTSMHCISQLASGMGEVMIGPATRGDFKSFHEQYVANYIVMFLDVFESNVSESELVFVGSAIYKLLTYHPLPIFLRLPQDLVRRWICNISQKAIQYTPLAVKGIAEDPTHDAFQALKLVYQSWASVVQAKNTYYKKFEITPNSVEFIDLATREIVQQLFHHLLNQFENETDTEDILEDMEEEDDLQLWSDHLRCVGVFVNACPRVCMDYFENTVSSNVRVLPDAYRSNDWATLRRWQERMHMILVVTGFSLTVEQSGFYIPTNIFNYCMEQAEERNVSSPEDGKRFIEKCIDHPENMEDEASIEPFIRIFGHLIRLCSLQYQLLMQGSAAYSSISPTVLRSSLWAVRRLVSGLSAADENPSTDSIMPDELYTISQLIMMEKGTELSQKVVNFFVSFCFDIIDKMSAEVKVCDEAIKLLNSIGEARPREVAGNDLFYQKLSGVKLEKVTSRRLLVSTLVAIGSMCEEPQHHDRMGNMILKPIADRFHAIVTTNASGSFSDVVDLLECFCGVAEAAQSFTANILLNYLFPILELCPQVMAGAKDEPPVVDGVLKLFRAVTKHLVIFIDELHVNRKVYDIVARLMEVYRDTQLDKYKNHLIDEEEQSSDLIYFLDVVTNILSKDIFTSTESSGDMSDGVKISLLEFNMLIPLMSKNLLNVPAVCVRFFKYLQYMTELYPETFSFVDEPTFGFLFVVMKGALSQQYGTEVMVNCVESVGHIAQYFLRPNVASVDFIKRKLTELLPEIFVLTMQNGSQVDIFRNGTQTLFNVICCSKTGFAEYVHHLIEMQATHEIKVSTASAFEELMADFDETGGRRHLRAFRDKFETFLARVKGQLCLNL